MNAPQFPRPSETGRDGHRPLLAALCFLLAQLQSNAQGTLVGIDFVGGDAIHGTPGALDFNRDHAGLVSQRFWNSASRANGGITGLYGDDGSAQIAIYFSGISVTWASPAGTGALPIEDLGGNSRMMKGCLLADPSSGDIQIRVSGIPAILTSPGYAVVVYSDAPNPDSARVALIGASTPLTPGSTVGLLDQKAKDFAGSLIQVPGWSRGDLGTLTPPGNCTVLGPFRDPQFTLTVQAGSTDGAIRQAGLNAIQLVSLSLLRLPPNVSLTFPVQGGTVMACAPQMLWAEASGSGRPLSRVEFYEGSTHLATITHPPCATPWRTDRLGTRTFTARAVDSAGLSTVSTPITATVVPPPMHVLFEYGLVPDGGCELCMQGEAVREYGIEAASDPTRWGPDLSTTLGRMEHRDGLLIFRDTNSPVGTTRLYRAVQE